MSILISSDVAGFFNEAVDTALSTRKVEASRGVREYLVGVLVDFSGRAGRSPTLDRPLTFLLRDALEAPPIERFERLRGLGDSSLYVSGLFQDHLEARGVDVSYVSSVGATAYQNASSLLHRDRGGPDLFSELAATFRALVGVLHDVADAIFAGSATDPGSLVRLYDRWRKTGSATLGRELCARGLVPIKESGGSN